MLLSSVLWDRTKQNRKWKHKLTRIESISSQSSSMVFCLHSHPFAFNLKHFDFFFMVVVARGYMNARVEVNSKPMVFWGRDQRGCGNICTKPGNCIDCRLSLAIKSVILMQFFFTGKFIILVYIPSHRHRALELVLAARGKMNFAGNWSVQPVASKTHERIKKFIKRYCVRFCSEDACTWRILLCGRCRCRTTTTISMPTNDNCDEKTVQSKSMTKCIVCRPKRRRTSHSVRQSITRRQSMCVASARACSLAIIIAIHYVGPEERTSSECLTDKCTRTKCQVKMPDDVN